MDSKTVGNKTQLATRSTKMLLQYSTLTVQHGWTTYALPCECPEFQTAVAFQSCCQQATPVFKADSLISRVTSGNTSLYTVGPLYSKPIPNKRGHISSQETLYGPKVSEIERFHGIPVSTI